MSRVVVTGMGLVSSIGSTLDDAAGALREDRSGLVQLPELGEFGLPGHVYGPVQGWEPRRVGRRYRITMSRAAEYAASAANDAIQDAGLDLDRTDRSRIATLIGTAFGGIDEFTKVHRCLTTGKKTRAGVTGTLKGMNATACDNVAAMLGLQGRAYSASTNAASGADNIGQAYELIRHGLSDVAVCGATEEDCWRQVGPGLAACGTLADGYNDRPTEACRPYDMDRCGTVMSAGAGILVLEALDHADGRGANPYAEIVGYGAASDGSHLLRPTGTGLRRAMQQALETVGPSGVHSIEYINTHATGTVLGDRIEAETIRGLFGEKPMVSSTKGLTGHALGACGALEAIHVLLMMSRGFVARTMNLTRVAPDCAGLRHVQETVAGDIQAAMSVNSGLGGFTSALAFRRIQARG